MKKYLILFFLISLASAQPLISDVSVQPQHPWIGDNVNITFSCFEENYSIEKVNVVFLSPIEIPNSSLNLKKQDKYYFSLPINYPYSGKYTFQIYCESNNTENNSTQQNFDFTVYNLTAYIDSIKPGKIYEGDEIKVFLRVKKNDLDLNASYQITFQTFLDNIQVQYTTPPYFDNSRGWVLSFKAAEGQHKIKIIAKIEEKNVVLEKEIFVYKNIDISFQSIDKTEVSSGENVVLKFFVKERDFKIDNSSLNLYLYFDSSPLPFNYSLYDSLEGTFIEIKAAMPEASLGPHTITPKIVYKNQELSKDIQITYPIKIISGFFNDDNTPFNGKIKFKGSGFERVFSTNSSGYFSGTLPKGTYDIEIELKDYPSYPGVKIILNKTVINSFDNPIKFDVLKNLNIDGLGIGAAYFIDVNLDFSKATLELSYDQRRIVNESEIIVYKCSEWNFAKSQCNVNLEELNVDIDKNENKVKIDVDSFSVFIISYRKKLNLNIIREKQNYILKDLATISGFVQDDEGNYISNADINVKILGAGIDFSTKTDKNGYFSYQFLTPEKEGIFRIDLKATKDQFIGDYKYTEINVTKSKKLVLFTEDSFKIYKGENITIPLKIINTGQADISKAYINISGLPSEFIVFMKNEETDIKSGEERNSPITIIVPASTNSTSVMVKIQISYEGFYAEKQLYLILDERLKENTIPTAKIVLPKIDPSIYLTFFSCVLIIIATYFLKKNKRKEKKDDLLKEIKKEIIKEKII